jgi:hypothetical protein
MIEDFFFEVEVDDNEDTSFVIFHPADLAKFLLIAAAKRLQSSLRNNQYLSSAFVLFLDYWRMQRTNFCANWKTNTKYFICST